MPPHPGGVVFGKQQVQILKISLLLNVQMKRGKYLGSADSEEVKRPHTHIYTHTCIIQHVRSEHHEYTEISDQAQFLRPISLCSIESIEHSSRPTSKFTGWGSQRDSFCMVVKDCQGLSWLCVRSYTRTRHIPMRTHTHTHKYTHTTTYTHLHPFTLHTYTHSHTHTPPLSPHATTNIFMLTHAITHTETHAYIYMQTHTWADKHTWAENHHEFLDMVSVFFRQSDIALKKETKRKESWGKRERATKSERALY